MTAPTTDVGALVARLRELATPERAKHGVPQDVAMLEAATDLEAESAARIAAERELNLAQSRIEVWKRTAKELADKADAAEARADREKARADHLAKQEVDIRAAYCLRREENAQLVRENKRLDREWAAAEAELAACRAEREGAVAALCRIERGAVMQAHVMRDPLRTGGWAGAEKVADAFSDIADRARAALSQPSEPDAPGIGDGE